MSEIIHVVYNIQHAGGGSFPPPPGLGATTTSKEGNGGEGLTEYSKEEVEKMTQVPGNETPKRFGTEAIWAYGPIQQAKVATLEAGSAANACKFVKYVLGGEVLGVVVNFAGKSKMGSAVEAPPTNKEQAEKPMDTIKTTALEITAAV